MISRTSGEIVLWILLLTFFKDQDSTLLKKKSFISGPITMNFHKLY